MTLSGHTGTIVKWQSSSDAAFTSPTDITNTATTYTATNLTATTYYRAVVQSGSCAVANSSNATITVSPASVGGSIAGGATVCTGTNSTTLTLSGHTGTIVKWQSSSDAAFTSPTDITNTATTYTATNLTATTYYRAVVQSGSCAVANSSNATVTVDPASVGGTIAGTGEVCSGTNSKTLTLSGHTGTIVKWQSSSDAAFTSPTDITNTTTTLVATNLTATTYYRAVVQSGSCATANSSTGTVTVNPAVVAGSCTVANDACQLSAGQIRIEVSGGTTPYTLTATGLPTGPNTGPAASAVTAPSPSVSGGVSTYLFTGLAGNVEYKFKVVDNKGCIVGSTH